MKKREAEQIAPEKVNFILNRIMQILEDNDRLFSANMNFSSAKIEKQCMCTLDIYVPYKKIEEHYNLGITNDHINVIYKAFFDRIIANYLNKDSISFSEFYSPIRTNMGSFDGIEVSNNTGSTIFINMPGIYYSLIDDYNLKISENNNSKKM